MRRFRVLVAVLIVAVAGVACAPKPVAASYEEYFVAACSAWESLFRAVGNPDTGSGSELSRQLDQAVAAGDMDRAGRIATEIAKELKAGREQIAVAAGWRPRAPVMVQMDRLFAAFEAMTAAKVSGSDPQRAFEAAGGVQAWFAMFEAARVAGGAAATDRQCANVPVTP